MSENIVNDYGWQSESGPQSCGYITPKIIDILKEIKSSRVLDIGAGNGSLCREIKAAGIDVVGVEYDVKGFEIAKLSNPNIKFYNFGVQDNPLELLRMQLPFDTVVSTEVIEHLFSPHLLPKYAFPVLIKGGHMILSTPYHGYLKNCLIALSNKWDHHHTSLWHGGHIKFWSRVTLSKLLEQNGFKIHKFYGVGRVPFIWKSMIIVAQKI